MSAPVSESINQTLQFKRGYNGPLDLDSVFTTTADRIAYLSNNARYAGQIVTDLQTNKAYMLNAAMNAWVELAGGGDSSFLTTSVTANNENIKALPTTYFELVPAPGENKAIHVIDIFAITRLSVAYTGIEGSSVQLFFDQAPANNIYASWEAVLLTLFPYYVLLTPNMFELGSGSFNGQIVSTGLISNDNWINKALTLKDDWNGLSNYGGGDPSNTIEFYTTYKIIDVE